MTIEIATRLQEYRKKSGLSQEQLAEKLGVSRQAVSKWERGESSPDTDNLIALANLYGVSLDELLGHRPQQPAGEPVKDHISFANGIHVHSKNGDKVDIDFSGIHVDSPKDNAHVHIDSSGVFVNENTFKREKSEAQKAWEHFPYPFIVIGAYLLFGTLNVCGGWALGWLIFLTIPLYYTLISAVFSKNPEHFAYPVLAALVYLYIGFHFNLWHPGWIVFWTIPIYYCLAECIKKARK